jgi:hypothetical protein
MRVFRLVPTFLLFLLLGGQVLLLPSQAYAQCCQGCGMCNPWWFWCTCPGGSEYCPYCRMDDSKSVQSIAPGGNSTLAVTEDARMSLLISVAKSDITERLMEAARGGKCFRDRVALSLLANARDGLKFELLRFDEMNLQGQTLALQMDGDKEK